VAGTSEVRWTRDGERFVHATEEPVPFVRQLLGQHGAELTDLEVRRANLEDTYIAMVQRYESAPQPARHLAGVSR